MATTRDELREDLVAAMEAAPEFPTEDRQHLADVFLDRLNADFNLVPRGMGKTPMPEKANGGGSHGRPWVPIVAALAFLFTVVPFIIHHFGIFLLLALVVFLIAKNGGVGRRAHRPLS